MGTLLGPKIYWKNESLWCWSKMELFWFVEPFPHEHFDPPDISGRMDLNFGILLFWILALEFSRTSAHVSELDLLFSRFFGSRQMDVQDICWGPDLDSPHRVSMDEPIFRPVGKTIVQVMDSVGPKIQNIAQSGWVHFLDSHNPTFNLLGPRKMADRLFFAITGKGAFS